MKRQEIIKFSSSKFPNPILKIQQVTDIEYDHKHCTALWGYNIEYRPPISGSEIILRNNLCKIR